MDLLEEAGCPLKTERGGRVFPVSDKSSDVIKALSGLLRDLDVEVHLNQAAEELIVEEENGQKICRGIRLSGRLEKKSEQTPSSWLQGDFLTPLPALQETVMNGPDQAGHQVANLSPALVPFETEGTTAREPSGTGAEKH